MAIHREKKPLGKAYLPTRGILTTTVEKLPPDSVVYQVCREIAKRRRTHVESFDGKTVLTLIKQCHQAFGPTLARPKKLTRLQRRHEFETDLIKRRRENGDL